MNSAPAHSLLYFMYFLLVTVLSFPRTATVCALSCRVHNPQMEVVGNHQHFCGPGLRVRGDHNHVTGPSCTVTGHHNTVTGPACTVYGHHNNVSGPSCRAVGDHNRLTGPGCSAVGNHNKYGYGGGNDNDNDNVVEHGCMVNTGVITFDDEGGSTSSGNSSSNSNITFSGTNIGVIGRGSVVRGALKFGKGNGMSMSNGNISFHGERAVGDVIAMNRDGIQVRGPNGSTLWFSKYTDANGNTYNSGGAWPTGSASSLSVASSSSTPTSSSASSSSSSSSPATTATTVPATVSGNHVLQGAVVNNGSIQYDYSDVPSAYYDDLMKKAKDTKANEKAAVDTVCVVCLDNLRKVAFDCGHHCVCVACAIRLADTAAEAKTPLTCPVCRHVSKRIILIYL